MVGFASGLSVASLRFKGRPPLSPLKGDVFGLKG